jgi:hypothetical protein
MRCRVLIWEGVAGTATSWRFNTSTVAGASSLVNVVMYGATGFGYVEIVDGNYISGLEQPVNLQVSHPTPAAGSGEIYLVGWSVAFDP